MTLTASESQLPRVGPIVEHPLQADHQVAPWRSAAASCNIAACSTTKSSGR